MTSLSSAYIELHSESEPKRHAETEEAPVEPGGAGMPSSGQDEAALQSELRRAIAGKDKERVTMLVAQGADLNYRYKPEELPRPLAGERNPCVADAKTRRKERFCSGGWTPPQPVYVSFRGRRFQYSPRRAMYVLVNGYVFNSAINLLVAISLLMFVSDDFRRWFIPLTSPWFGGATTVEDYEEQPEYHTGVYDFYICFMFLFEFLCKIWALGCKRFFKSGANRFDAFLVLFCMFMDIVLQSSKEYQTPWQCDEPLPFNRTWIAQYAAANDGRNPCSKVYVPTDDEGAAGGGGGPWIPSLMFLRAVRWVFWIVVFLPGWKDANQWAKTPLHYAIMTGDASMVEHLIAMGCDRDSQAVFWGCFFCRARKSPAQWAKTEDGCRASPPGNPNRCVPADSRDAILEVLACDVVRGAAHVIPF